MPCHGPSEYIGAGRNPGKNGLRRTFDPVPGGDPPSLCSCFGGSRTDLDQKNKGRYLLSFGLSLGGVVILLFTELVLVPWQITRYLDGISFFSEAVESALGMLDICRIAMGVLGTEYLVGALLLAVMSCLCLAGNFLKENIPSGEREKEQPEEKTMSLERSRRSWD